MLALLARDASPPQRKGALPRLLAAQRPPREFALGRRGAAGGGRAYAHVDCSKGEDEEGDVGDGEATGLVRPVECCEHLHGARGGGLARGAAWRPRKVTIEL